MRRTSWEQIPVIHDFREFMDAVCLFGLCLYVCIRGGSRFFLPFSFYPSSCFFVLRFPSLPIAFCWICFRLLVMTFVCFDDTSLLFSISLWYIHRTIISAALFSPLQLSFFCYFAPFYSFLCSSSLFSSPFWANPLLSLTVPVSSFSLFFLFQGAATVDVKGLHFNRHGWLVLFSWD